MTAVRYCAEFVFPGHPDKLADAIADALVAEAMRREARALVGLEVAVHRAAVYVTGRIACQDAEAIDVPAVVRSVYHSAGYGPAWQPAPADLVVHADLCLGPLEDGEAQLRSLSDDQVICIGHAVDSPATQYLPVEQFLVHRLAKRLHGLRDTQAALALGPDGKVILALRCESGRHELDWFSTSLQQRSDADAIGLHRAVRLALEDELAALATQIPGLSPVAPHEISVNGAGAFEIGGPEGDNGLSGKKLVMDAYGPRIPIGGGAWSGKDFFKADRAGGLYARRLARLIVQLGHAAEVTVTLGCRPGDRAPTLFNVSGVTLPIARRCAALLDGSLEDSGRRWSAAAGDLVDIARWGHFTQVEGRPWEQMGGW